MKNEQYDAVDALSSVEDVMSTDVVTFSSDDRLSDVCKSLMESNFRRVPIVDKGKLVGIISRRDLLACNILNNIAASMNSSS